MNIADIKKIIGFNKKKISSTEETMEPSSNIDDYEDSSASFVEGEKAVVRGVKRPVVLGIGVTLIATFLIGIFWGMSSNENDAPKKQPETKAMSENELNSLQPDAEQLSRLSQYNQSNQSDKAVQQPQQIKRLQPANSDNAHESEAYRRNQYQTLPVIPQTQRYSSHVLPQPAVSTAGEDDRNIKKEVKELFDSAIAFTVGNNKNTDNKNTENIQPLSSSMNGTGTMNTYVPINENMLQAGTLIPAMLITGINTDAGDIAQAQITANVYDSLTGNNLLIPAGSKVLGNYKAGNNGRINIDWQTLVIPDGGSWNIGNSMTAVDSVGYSGLKGHVDSHAGRVLSSGAIATGLSAIAGIAGGNSSVSNNSYSYGQLAAQGAMANFLNTASSLFQKNINAAETVTIEPGYQFNIFVTQTITF